MANMTRYDPLGEMVTLRQAMDRLFEDSFVNPLTWRTVNGTQLTPPVDVHQTEDEIVVSAALPGAKPEEVEITVTGQTLLIRGEMKADETIDREKYVYRERRYGSFARQLELPVQIQGEKAAASFSDGVLTVRIPKAEEVKPRQIRVSAGTGDSNVHNGSESA